MSNTYEETKNLSTDKNYKPKYEYPHNSSNESNPFLLFHAFEYKLLAPQDNIAKIDTTRHLGSVKLYVPGGITYTIGNNFEEESYVASVSHAINSTINKLKEMIPAIPQALQSISGGYALYPATVKVFQQTQFKSLSVSYKFVPRNRSEADEVEAIIRFFRMCALPGKAKNKSFSQWLLKPPAILEIKLGYAGKKQNSTASEILHYKNMVISSFNLTYSPDSESFLIYEDGMPVSVSISMNLDSITPIEPLDRDV